VEDWPEMFQDEIEAQYT
jgi:IMP dehydrogenase/GMP reductase